MKASILTPLLFLLTFSVPATEANASDIDQATYVSRLKYWSSQYTSSKSAVQLDEIVQSRYNEICSLIGGNDVRGWVGTIDHIGSSDGSISISVFIAGNIRLTGMIDLKDFNYQNMYKKLHDARQGDKLYFAGTFPRSLLNKCFQDLRLTKKGRVQDPHMAFKFSDVKLDARTNSPASPIASATGPLLD